MAKLKIYNVYMYNDNQVNKDGFVENPKMVCTSAQNALIAELNAALDYPNYDNYEVELRD